MRRLANSGMTPVPQAMDELDSRFVAGLFATMPI
jgi:hypothetical protein